MRNPIEYLFHCVACLLDSDYRRHSEKPEAPRLQKKTIEHKLDAEQVQMLRDIQQTGSD